MIKKLLLFLRKQTNIFTVVVLTLILGFLHLHHGSELFKQTSLWCFETV